MTLSFFIDGLPKAQPRARACSRGGFARVYNPSTADGWKDQIAVAAKANIPATPIAGAVSVKETFIFPRPKSHFTKKGLRPNAPVLHIIKPDRDNLDKAVLDKLKRLGFFNDDCQVCAGGIMKIYGDRPGCLVEIQTL